MSTNWPTPELSTFSSRCRPVWSQAARDFYQGLLGIPEARKPAKLAARGGAWFENGSAKIHLGVEDDSGPRAKRIPRCW